MTDKDIMDCDPLNNKNPRMYMDIKQTQIDRRENRKLFLTRALIKNGEKKNCRKNDNKKSPFCNDSNKLSRKESKGLRDSVKRTQVTVTAQTAVNQRGTTVTTRGESRETTAAK